MRGRFRSLPEYAIDPPYATQTRTLTSQARSCDRVPSSAGPLLTPAVSPPATGGSLNVARFTEPEGSARPVPRTGRDKPQGCSAGAARRRNR